MPRINLRLVAYATLAYLASVAILWRMAAPMRISIARDDASVASQFEKSATPDRLPPKWLVGWRPGDPLPVTQTPYGSPVTPHYDPPCAPRRLAAEARRYNVPVCKTLYIGGPTHPFKIKLKSNARSARHLK